MNPSEFIEPRSYDKLITDQIATQSFKHENDIRPQPMFDKMTASEITRYMLECIFDVWFKVFNDSIQFYPKLYHTDFIRFSYNFLKTIKRQVFCLM